MQLLGVFRHRNSAGREGGWMMNVRSGPFLAKLGRLKALVYVEIFPERCDYSNSEYRCCLSGHPRLDGSGSMALNPRCLGGMNG